MNFRFRDLWSPTGTVDRGTYVIVGVLGFVIKHNLDRFIAYRFQHTWGLFSYWEPLRNAGRITALSRPEETFLAALVATALPFIWIGVVMTLKRLRSAGISTGYVFLFFVPFLICCFSWCSP